MTHVAPETTGHSEPGPVRTTCPYCGVGCGVLATPLPKGVRIKGDPEHPANHGRLCSKGSALGETLSLATRLLYPEIAGRRVSWDTALDTVARRFSEAIAEHGPDSVAFYVSGQLLTEDYYVANKLMKGFIGSANIDTNSRLCMASSVAGHRRAFGEDLVPGCYEDLELADLVVLVGSNAAWCHPVIHQRLMKALERNPAARLVTIDPRRTATAESADLHLAVAPGTDVILFAGLLDYLRRNDGLDYDFIERHTEGLAGALNAARQTALSIPAVAAACGLAEGDVSCFYHWFARTPKAVTAWSQGVNQSSAGTDKVNAIVNVHLATGRIGQPGMGPFSLTGQPNAMGGREVGGLANQLAAHLDIENADHRELVQDFWRSPRIAERPGLKAVDLFRAVGEGRIKAVWIIATNPVASLPDINAARAALGTCPFVVVSDCEAGTDLSRYAHVQLPALAWGEKDGTVTNSERRISRQRAFLPAPGEARADWWMLAEVGRRMGYGEAFRYHGPDEIFREHAVLSGYRNAGRRVFDIAGLSGLDAEGYDGLQPMQWPVTTEMPEGSARLEMPAMTDRAGRRARFVPVAFRAPLSATDPEYPLILNTGRIRDQWHTMTRTGKAARLNAHLSEPYAELHPRDAAALGIMDGALVRLISRHGTMLARARVTDAQQSGSVFAPMHWTDANARGALVNALVGPACDPVSGEPESKFTPVRVEAYRSAWQGFALSRQPLAFPDATYCVAIRGRGHWLYELAGDGAPDDWGATARAAGGGDGDEWLEFSDPRAGRYRCARLSASQLAFCLFVETGASLPARDWLGSLFGGGAVSEDARRALLSGRPAAAGQDPGRTVCSCFGVGINTLRTAIREHGLTTTAEIGDLLKAGRNCGSCVPELRILLQEARVS
ncbi:nitrate reductase [Methylolobus aquaticus]|nr:nitrate reductase [Methylolobus aquaticus]